MKKGIKKLKKKIYDKLVEPEHNYKCHWCRKKATRKDYRDIDGIVGSVLSCEKCFGLSTEYLLEKYG